MNEVPEKMLAPYKWGSIFYLRGNEISLGEIDVIRPSVQDDNILNFRADFRWIIRLQKSERGWFPIAKSMTLKNKIYFGKPELLPSRIPNTLRFMCGQEKITLSILGECRIFALRMRDLHDNQ